jgi:hypothetical protein
MATRLWTTRRRARPALRLLSAAALIAGTVALTGGANARAAVPGGTDPDAKYYLSSVTAIEPATPGLEVVVHGSGDSVTMTNRTGKQVIVVGYSGEDFLRFSSSGVDKNVNSLTAALEQTQGKGPLPKKFDAASKLPTKWQRVSNTNSLAWSDFRTRWGANQRPPIVSKQPHSRHQVFVWAIQLKVGKQATLVRGDVTWIGTPAPARTNLVAKVGVAALILALIGAGLAIGLRRRRRRLARSRTISRVQHGRRASTRAAQAFNRAEDPASDNAVNSTGARF